jgi:RNA polymerase sigma-32 factor
VARNKAQESKRKQKADLVPAGAAARPVSTADPRAQKTPSAAGAAALARRAGDSNDATTRARPGHVVHAKPSPAREPEAEEESEGQPHPEDTEARDDEAEVVDVVGEVLVDDPIDLTDVGDVVPTNGRASAVVRGQRTSDFALSRVDPLQAYLHEIQRHPLLTGEEERTLTLHYLKTQDVATAARLVTANLRLVVKLAYEYRRAYKNIMDLIQEGNIGLMQAVKRYDPYRGVKLSSYAAWWIRAYILRFILNNWRLVKLGTTQAQRKLFFNLNREKAKLSAMGIEPTADEIARRLNVDESEVIEMDRRLSAGEASLDAPLGDSDGRPVSRLEMMPSGRVGPDMMVETHEMGALVHDRLGKFREQLKGKDVVIFDKRMAAEDPLTLQELGNEFGVSRERVRQLEARLTMKLREYLKDELGDAVDAG